MLDWDIVYKRAYNPDGSLFFPERITEEFLEQAKRKMGSYLFANQYLNEVFPPEKQIFQRAWFKYFDSLPMNTYRFCFIDPAISTSDTADYSAFVVVEVDAKQDWHVIWAQRLRITPTELMQKIFDIQAQFRCQTVGVESVAYQKMILYMMDEEMRRRGVQVPLVGINPGTDKSKEARILGLVPRFEWGHILLARGLVDLEMELLQFPRGNHDDTIDALASIEEIIYYPSVKETHRDVKDPNDPRYESQYIRNLVKRSNQGSRYA